MLHRLCLSLAVAALTLGCASRSPAPEAPPVPTRDRETTGTPDVTPEASAPPAERPPASPDGPDGPDGSVSVPPGPSTAPPSEPILPVPANAPGVARELLAARKAERLFQAGDYRGCGLSFGLAAERSPKSPYADSWLYNAAVCMRQARDIEGALRMSEKLLSSYPTSPLAARTMYSLAQGNEAIGRLESAARHYERFVARYPADRDSWDALLNAITLRRALGHPRRATRNIELMERLFGRKRPARVAEIAFSALYRLRESGDDKALTNFLQRFLQRHGKHSSPAIQLIAHSELGMAWWRRSCQRPAADGTCVAPEVVRQTRKQPRPRRCSGGGRTPLRPLERKQRLVRRARKSLRAAIALRRALNRGPQRDFGDRDQARAREALAAAQFHLAELEYETVLSAAFPKRLDFQKKLKRSSRKFQRWLTRRERATSKVQAMHTEVMKSRSARWSVAAAARMGALMRHFADELYLAHVPKDLRRGKGSEARITAYCDTLADAAKPLAQAALDAFAMCAQMGQRLRYFDDVVARCHRELAAMRPQEHALLREQIGASRHFEVADLTAGQPDHHWRDRVDAAPKDRKARLALAATLLAPYRQAAGRDKQVLERRLTEQLQAALMLEPSDSRAHVLLALMHIASGEPARLAIAELHVQIALRVTYESPFAHNALGLVANARDQHNRAAMYFERAAVLRPKSAEIRLNAGLRALAGYDFERAHTHLEAALAARPRDYDATVALGVALRGLGKYAEASATYRRAAAIDAGRPEAYFNHGLLHKEFLAGTSAGADKTRAALQEALRLFQHYRGLPGLSRQQTAEVEASIAETEKALAALP